MKMQHIFFSFLGQKLSESAELALKELPADASFVQKLLVKHRQLIGNHTDYAIFHCRYSFCYITMTFFNSST